jgi:excisionase family DNA binding protein
MENGLSDILTIDEAAELLKIPRSSVYRLSQQGKIPARKVGRHWRFHRGVLLSYVAGVSNLDSPIRTSELAASILTDLPTD